MNIAQRYKRQIENNKNEKGLQNSPKPEEKTTVKTIENPVCSKVIHIETKFKQIENDTLSKINKTPYWKDYTPKRQEQMISKYFDMKIKKEGTQYSGEEKSCFIKNILKTSNEG